MGIAVGRFVPVRYFCWAPFEETSFYEIEATLNGTQLDPSGILKRYGLGQQGRNNRAIHHVIAVLRWQEKHSIEQAQVRLKYQTNGGEEQIWVWPEEE